MFIFFSMEMMFYVTAKNVFDPNYCLTESKIKFRFILRFYATILFI